MNFRVRVLVLWCGLECLPKYANHVMNKIGEADFKIFSVDSHYSSRQSPQKQQTVTIAVAAAEDHHSSSNSRQSP